VKYYIITGEPSGDIHASNLVSEIKLIDNNNQIRAWGGERLSAENISIAKNIKETSFMGLWNVIKNISKIKSNLSFCKRDIVNFNPDALILVDYPGFNLKIAEFAKNKGFKVYYYISPKVWAWNESRIAKIKSFIDHLIVIFPFEVDFFSKFNLNVAYFGNPLLDEISNNELKFSLKSVKPIIALLPGSRLQEIKSILPIMLSVIDYFPNYQFIIAANKMISLDIYKKIIDNKNVDLVFGETYGLLNNSKYALVTSGTATLETALFNVPQIICYRTNYLTYLIAKTIIKTKYISLVNILLNRLAVKELIQSQLNTQNLKKELDFIINDSRKIYQDYKILKKQLNEKGASKKIAEFIYSSI
tara:strand:+ start:16259 stop:17338 length:1080 start_codon:yes stop_codon:yes gene_type:complete